MRETSWAVRCALAAVVAVLSLVVGVVPAEGLPLPGPMPGVPLPFAPETVDGDPSGAGAGVANPYGLREDPTGSGVDPDADPMPDEPPVLRAPDEPSEPVDGASPTDPDQTFDTPKTDTVDPTTVGAHVFQGSAFDTCTAPDLETMAAWRESSYGAIGVYVGGRARGCSQERLTRAWVRSVTEMGWRILPLYVGSQSPCVSNAYKRRFPIEADRAGEQGASEAADAVRQAASLGIGRGSPIYFDMEAYDDRTAECSDPVLAFVRSWSRDLREQGYLPGFYSSADSGVVGIVRARARGVTDLPELMWFARWDVPASVYGEPQLPADAWRPHRRVHQYVGEVRETHGGRSLDIDRDLVDAPVAVVI